MWGYPDHIDQDAARIQIKEQGDRGLVHAGQESYHHMCRFYSLKFYDHPAIQPYKWYWRIEPGISFTCPINFDPFAYMSREKKRYAYAIALQEVGSTVRSLYRVVSDYKDRMKIAPSRYWDALVDPSWAPLPIRWLLRLAPYRDVNGDEWNLCHFWNNFEIADLDFFREDRQTRRVPFTSRATGYQNINGAIGFEEEAMPAFSQKLYLPVHLGDIYHNRYQIVTKLGYGSNSTVWLCLDHECNSFVALKIYTCTSPASREPRVLAELAKVRSQHPGSKKIRLMLDSFEVISKSGSKHVCLVHGPLLMSLQRFQDLFKYKILPTSLFKIAVQDVLFALDFLHTEGHMVHTDSSIFEKLLEEERIRPSARKITDGYTIYQSRSFTLDEVVANVGPLLLTDFGETRTRAEDWLGLIQPDPFRSPEVILGMPWTSKTDIWNLGVMAWRLFEDHLLFEDRDSEGNHSEAQLLAHITAILGPAPLSFVNRSPDRALYWDETGEWIGKVDIPDDSIEESDERLLDKDLKRFATFMRKMLQWNPDHRQCAAELLEDEWLLDISD
ncbi:kinase-like protein, partial [Aureobasidium melanogenum]